MLSSRSNNCFFQKLKPFSSHGKQSIKYFRKWKENKTYSRSNNSCLHIHESKLHP